MDYTMKATTTLAGQTALVTGASSGLGARFAYLLAMSGARVVLSARRLSRLAALADHITRSGGVCLPVQMDVARPETFSALVDDIESRFGRVTILVNNAGVPDADYAVRLRLDVVDQVIATNLRGPFILSCEIARRLIAAKESGRIVNISAIGAYAYAPDSAAALYATTKAGLNRMTEVLAIEWARFGINVNAIAPGMVHSEMTAGLLKRVGNASDAFPRKRIGDASILDATLLYLLAPESEYVTGTIVKVDDGQTAR